VPAVHAPDAPVSPAALAGGGCFCCTYLLLLLALLLAHAGSAASAAPARPDVSAPAPDTPLVTPDVPAMPLALLVVLPRAPIAEGGAGTGCSDGTGVLVLLGLGAEVRASASCLDQVPRQPVLDALPTAEAAPQAASPPALCAWFPVRPAPAAAPCARCRSGYTLDYMHVNERGGAYICAAPPLPL
jgi:hypothetical protein